MGLVDEVYAGEEAVEDGHFQTYSGSRKQEVSPEGPIKQRKYCLILLLENRFSEGPRIRADEDQGTL